MILISETLRSAKVTLTGYLWSESAEFQDMTIRPAILVFPGGGYQMCSDREAEPIALAYMAEGYNTFVLRYSVKKDDFKDAFNDANEALEMLHKHADEWHISSDKIAVIGFSAGGHLAAMLGATGKIKPNAVILGYPAIFSKEGQKMNVRIPDADECVDETMPPTFIFATSTDEVVPIANSLAIANSLDKAKVPFELHIFAQGSHGLSLAKTLTANGSKQMVNPIVSQWFNMSIDWLREQFGNLSVTREGDSLENQQTGLSINSPLEKLLSDEKCLSIIMKNLPQIVQMAAGNPMMKQASLKVLSNYIPNIITESILQQINDQLNELS
ncbi:MAG: alpha/beta hydrolase [Lachnospiraceae bacterium]|nr:alpha/beta hydrolase [Lachnospiraceae bacterium]